MDDLQPLDPPEPRHQDQAVTALELLASLGVACTDDTRLEVLVELLRELNHLVGGWAGTGVALELEKERPKTLLVRHQDGRLPKQGIVSPDNSKLALLMQTGLREAVYRVALRGGI